MVIAGTGVSQSIAGIFYGHLAPLTTGNLTITAIPSFGLGHSAQALNTMTSLLKNSNRVNRNDQGEDVRIDLMGHSQGGLIALALANKCPEKVRKVLTFGAPFFGTALSNSWVPLPAARCMAPGSRWLKSLVVPDGVDVCSFFTPNDRLVVPFTSSYLPNARNFVVSTAPPLLPGCEWVLARSGHISLVKNSTVLAKVKELLDEEV